ncbi:MFS family permease [Trueperella bonasi]|uniref:MFS family permease n=1 Tax=Trueperella bonasi TaxID=312286 RepID=A0ABT9NGE6_9ACTO|nr:MFS transporter [Trueperella bonasi]MDP9806461.1 MFS family permease [Trueperella bonasi]
MAPEAHPHNREDLVLSTKKSEDRRVAVGTLVGTAVEWYDFFIYANAAAIVFAPLFFDPFVQGAGEIAGRLISFATVGISFFFRPLGAAIAGHYGDKLGRKAMLVATLLMMGIATFVIGLLPTYASAGVIAPIALLILRILQGLAAGGEWGGAALMAVEHAPVKKRGLYGGFPQIGVPLGMLMATLVLTVVSVLTTDEQFMSWGWRVPFLFSLVLIGIGMWIRLGVSESPVMEEIREADEKDEQVRLPIVDMFKTAWKPLIQSALVFAGNGVAGYMITGGFILSYTTQDRGLDRDTILNFISITAVMWIISTIFSAWLSDKIGRKPVYMIGFVIQIVWVWVLFGFVQNGTMTQILLGMLVWAIPIGFTYGPQAAMFAEMFPAKIRYSGAGLGNAFGAILGGAFAPLIATYLVAQTGTTNSVAIYIAIVTVVAAIALVTIPNSTGRDLSPAADGEINAEIEKIAAEEEGVIETTFERGAGF